MPYRKLQLAHRNAESCNWDTAARMRFCPDSSSSQNWRTSATRISALVITPLSKPANLSRWRLTLEVLSDVACYLYPSLYLSGGFSPSVVREFFNVHARHFDVDVDSVEHRSRNPFSVTGSGLMRAGAGFDGASKNNRMGMGSWLQSVGNLQGKLTSLGRG